jgi:hypothetical protein
MTFKQATAYDTSAKAMPAQSKMNEQHAFTIVVKSCNTCPYAKHRIKHCNITISNERAGNCYTENKDAITPSCPMWSEAKPIGELK